MTAEEFIKDCTKRCSNIIPGECSGYDWKTTYQPWLTPDEALRAVEIAREEMMDKTCNFLEMLGQGFTITDEITHNTYNVEQLMIDFKNYIKD